MAVLLAYREYRAVFKIISFRKPLQNDSRKQFFENHSNSEGRCPVFFGTTACSVFAESTASHLHGWAISSIIHPLYNSKD